MGEEIVIDPVEVKADPDAWRQAGEDTTEQLDCTPARFSRRRLIRRKFVKRVEPHQAPVIAALDTPAERNLAAPGLLAHIIPANFTGVIGCDGYAAYQTHAAQSAGGVRLAACRAHALRKFDEAKEANPWLAGIVPLLIQRLYQIEKQLREAGANANCAASGTAA